MKYRPGQAVVIRWSEVAGVTVTVPMTFVGPASKKKLICEDKTGERFEIDADAVYPSQEALEARLPYLRFTTNTETGRTTEFRPEPGFEVEHTVWVMSHAGGNAIWVEVYVDDTDEIILAKKQRLDQAWDTKEATNYACSISGYSEDSRDLHEIPEVRGLCQRLIALGFAACLDPIVCLATNQIREEGVTPLPVPPECLQPFLGGLEIYLLAEGRMQLHNSLSREMMMECTAAIFGE